MKSSFLFTLLLSCLLSSAIGAYKSPFIKSKPTTTLPPRLTPLNQNAPRVPPSNSNTPRVPPSNSYTPRVPPSNSYTPRVPPSNSYTPRVPPSNSYTPRVPPSNPNAPHSQTPDYGLDTSPQSTPDPYSYLNPYPPPPPSVEIIGLAVAKQYLHDFGYMTNSSYPFSDILDTETISAINTYQKFFMLEVTGQLDTQTLNQMFLPRCVVPDINLVYDLNSETSVSWPQGIRWFPNGTSTNRLTYGFLPESNIPLDFQMVFIDAFNRWSEAIAELNLAKLSFTETNYNTSDIKIGFYFLDNTVENVVAGTIMRYEDGSYNGNGNKVVGDIRLDASKYWILPGFNGMWSWLDGEFDLGTVAMHQIGHILGLSHSSIAKSVMYPSILTTNEIKVELTADDKNNILNVYREVSSPTISGSGGHFTPFGSCALLLINFSLGFILLLY
ncbi:hypothetical protein TanjilG_25594 [Lupinus angustifolius]|uniref:Peptidase metallopeptidase domain-containing protein n=1 Tax=Lupinus angustifolius TaxID=3871 RepID=A0A4P1QTB7_LUPAN|nr:PREDICTED: metalloendoproteinase 1-like [Lupinus angustifolius]OIV94532.1 hypothetical protein TanjilG_25594 [Lupinus angustifolius]